MLYGLFRVIGRLPFGALYVLADVLALLMHRVAGYRRKVVRRNLEESFPEMSARERRDVERKFYRFLADCFVETVKLSSISDAEMRRRMVFENLDEVSADLREGRNVSVYLGHYGNWEWISSLPLHLEAPVHACQIYHRLRSKSVDRLYLRLRSRFGATSVAMDDALTSLLADRREGRPNITGYISDQAPKYYAVHRFIPVLNHPETAVITGTERLARMMGSAVYYAEVSRPRRGYYVCRFVKLADDAAALPKFELTDSYWRHLEATIRRRPELWLWSHKRWKRTLEEMKRNYPQDWERRMKRL